MTKKPRIFIGKDSGFVSFKSQKLSLAFNLYGHQDLENDVVDPRLIGGVPFWMCFGDRSIIPAPPYFHGYSVSGPSKIPFGVRIGKVVDTFIKWGKNKLHSSGFLSYLIKGNNEYIFQGFEEYEVDEKGDILSINGSGYLWNQKNGLMQIIINSFSAIIPKIKHKKNYSLINKSDLRITKKIEVTNELLYIEDDYSQNDLKNYHVIPFTFRSFSNVELKYMNHYVIFESLDKRFSVAVSLIENEKVHLKEKLYSSTGEVILWEFINYDASEKSNILKRIIIPFDKSMDLVVLDKLMNKILINKIK